MSKDDGRFTKKTRRILAERVCCLCSCPTCRKHTAGPNSNPEKSTVIGEAAHIRALKPDTPARRMRYDESMTNAERANIKNGIWLCAACHKMIDGDGLYYTVELLEQWKEEAEEYARRKMEGRKEKKRKHRYEFKAITGKDGHKEFVREDHLTGRLEDAEGFYRLERKPKEPRNTSRTGGTHVP